jgi:hypothetical protein
MMKRIIVILLLIALVGCAAPPEYTAQLEAVYYVSPSGVDTNPGTQSQPWKTIQKCLNTVKAGDTCNVLSGTYAEALTIKVTGTPTARITLLCNGLCTVNSGASRTIATSGAISYYTIDGFRLLSTLVNSAGDPMSASVSFSYNFWGDGHTFERGNDGFILRNCYVEGAVYFYGSDNLVENCELNGRGLVPNGLTERSQPSENNVFRNNIIHDYTIRAGWSLQMTDNTLWTGNTIYNVGEGIDCDGAGSAVYGCNITNNLIYNSTGEVAILLENTFDSLITNNVIHSSIRGISVINYNISNGTDPFKSDRDYKGLVTNTIISHNLIYNISNDGVLCKATRGNTLEHNTIQNVRTVLGYWAGIGLAGYTQVYCPDWVISGNIVSLSPKTIWYEGNVPITINNNYYDVFSMVGSGTKTFAQWQAMGKDVNSIIGNPMFVNPASGDFHLQPGSPACGYGAYPCTVMASSTPTHTPTQTATNTLIPTGTPTSTYTPTITATPSPTMTYTDVPTETPTPTRTPECHTVVFVDGSIIDVCKR